MPDQEVVIVDRSGTEHVFPPGFDPQRAAKIVRNSGAGSSEPGTFAEGFHKSLKEDISGSGGVAGGLTGFVEGAADRVRHPLDTLAGIVKGGIGAVADTVKGADHLLTSPETTLGSAYESIKGIPQNMLKTGEKVLEHAG